MPLVLEGPKAARLSGVEDPRPPRVVLVLDGPMSPTRRTRLAAAGIRLSDYLGERRWLAEIPIGTDVQKSSAGMVLAAEARGADARRSPELGTRPLSDPRRQALRDAGRVQAVITLVKGATDAEHAELLAAIAAAAGKVHWSVPIGGNETIGAELPLAAAGALSTRDAVLFIEEAPELTVRNDSVRWIVQSTVPLSTPVWDRGLSGVGEVLGVIDDPIDVDHCSFLDPINPVGPLHRKVVAYNATPATPGSPFNQHGTHVAAIGVGDAGDASATRGLAYGARLAYSPVPVFAEGPMGVLLDLHAAQGARVHTNSWGDENDQTYSSLCRGIDAFAFENEDHLVVFAATNESELRSPENAKGVLAVGASGDEPDIDDWCTGGAGPTLDGRRKPEVYAPGCGVHSAASGTACGLSSQSGTSMASPAVAAAALLAREYLREGFYPGGVAGSGPSIAPSGALLRAMMINSAVDLTGLAGYPGRREGYGRIVLDRVLRFAGDDRTLVLRDARHASGLETGGFADVHFSVGPGSAEGGAAGNVVVTLAWTDPPAAPGAIWPSVNDLDVECVAPSGAVYIGGQFADGASVPWAWGAGELPDRVNTVEHVIIPAGAAEEGVWRARVRGAAVNEGPQGFALVITGDVSEIASTATAVAVAPTIASRIAGTPTSVHAAVRTGAGQMVVPGGVRLKQRPNPGAPWMTTAMTPGEAGSWEGTLFPASCGDAPEFFVEVQTNIGVVTDPPGGAATPYVPTLAPQFTVLADDFEFERGWTGGVPGDTATSGQWIRVDPNGTSAQPPDDHSSGLGRQCWVTGQGPPAGQVNTADVDGGITTLLSPRMDLAGAGSAVFTYYRWYDNSRGGTRDDPFTVQVSNDDGETWVTAETIGPTGAGAGGGWVLASWDAAALLPMTDRVRVRFTAQDLGANSTVEAAIDDFRVDRSGCAEPVGATGSCCTLQGCVVLAPPACAAAGGVWGGATSVCTPALACCPANFNLMNGATVQDVYDYLEAWVSFDPRADVNGSGGITVQDVYDFFEAWLAGCAG